MSLPPSRLASFSVDRPFHTGSNSKGIFSPQQPLSLTMLQNKHSAIAKLQVRSSHSFQSSEREIHKPFKLLWLSPHLTVSSTPHLMCIILRPGVGTISYFCQTIHTYRHMHYVFYVQPKSDSPGSHPTIFNIMRDINIPQMQISGLQSCFF